MLLKGLQNAAYFLHKWELKTYPTLSKYFPLSYQSHTRDTDVINHNGRKIGRFKPLYEFARPGWRRLFESTSSLPIFKGLFIYGYLQNISTYLSGKAQCYEVYSCKHRSQNMHAYPAKSSRFESTDFASVMIDDVGCSRRHQCTQCESQGYFSLFHISIQEIAV